MFLCDTCHKGCPNSDLDTMFMSYGRCEGCGKTGGCADCHTDFPRPKRRIKPTLPTTITEED